MLDFLEGIKGIHPGIFVHSVYIEEELDKDRQAGFVRLSVCPVLMGWLTSLAVRKRERPSRARSGTAGKHNGAGRRVRRDWVLARCVGCHSTNGLQRQRG